MKKYLLFVLLFLAACSSTPTEGIPCHQMGDTWVGDCDLDENGQPRHMEEISSDRGNVFSQNVSDVPEAEAVKIEELNTGDTFALVAEIVRQNVKNQTLKRLAYNGQIPGPLLKVPQNAEITIDFTNNTDVDTTIHPHGLRLENEFDGVPDVTQDPVQPGETFSYRFRFPDAGIYWYHPHIREDYAQELGLYGNFLVVPEVEDYWNPVNREEVLVLDDILLEDDGFPDFSRDSTDHALMGRFGNVLLLNNQEHFKLDAEYGQVIRFYITNVANTRTFNFAIPQARMKLVGGDGGRVEREKFVDSLVIAPSERYVVEVLFSGAEEYEIQHITPNRTYSLGKVVIGDIVVSNLQVLPELKDLKKQFETLDDHSSDFAEFRKNISEFLKEPPEKEIRLSLDMAGMMSGMEHDMGGHGMMMPGSDTSDGIEWEDDMGMMNRMSTSKNVTWKIIDEQTGRENMDIDWEFSQGDLVKIRISNDPDSLHPMQHPIHFHGNRFLVLSRDGVANNDFVWKDTTLVKTGETVDILLEASNPGTWMAHCHIAEHLHSGMMFSYKIQDQRLEI